MNDPTRPVPAPAINSILAVVMTARALDASDREYSGLRPIGGITQLAARALTESSRDYSPDPQVLCQGVVTSRWVLRFDIQLQRHLVVGTTRESQDL